MSQAVAIPTSTPTPQTPPDPSIVSRTKKNKKNPHFCYHFLDDFRFRSDSFVFITNMPTLITARATNAAGDCEFEQQQQQPAAAADKIHNPYDTTTLTMGPQSQQNNGSIKKCRKAASTYKKNKGSLKSIWFLEMLYYLTGLSSVDAARNTKNTSRPKSRKESGNPTSMDTTTLVSLERKKIMKINKLL
jgi:hypothetical protein